MMSVLQELRALRPRRELEAPETFRVAEHQAAKLRRLQDVTCEPVPEEIITELPRIALDLTDLGRVSALAHWETGVWRIAVNRRHAPVRQRFSIAHEFHHVLEAPFERWAPPHDRAEQAADYFAACLLMPKAWIYSAFAADGVQDIATLSRRFEVSRPAMERRLQELGLIDRSARCAPIRGYSRQPTQRQTGRLRQR